MLKGTLLVALLLAGCGGGNFGGAAVAACVTNTTEACVCPGSVMGAQACTDDGNWGKCVCPGATAEGDGGGGDAEAVISEARCASQLVPGTNALVVGAVDGKCKVTMCEPGYSDCDGFPVNGCEAALAASKCGFCNGCPGSRVCNVATHTCEATVGM